MMRSLLVSFIVLIAALAAQAQPVTNVLPATSEPGIPVTLTIEASGATLTGATRATLTQGSWTFNSTALTVLSPTVAEADFVISFAAPLGFYSTAVFLKTASTPGLFELVAGSGPKGTVSGTVYVDGDGDCLHDAGELTMGSKLVEFSPGPYYALTDSFGDYSASLPVGSYTVTPVAIPGLSFVCPSPTPSHTASLPSLGSTATGKDFGLDATAFTDLSVVGSAALSTARPGFDNYLRLQVANIGILSSPACTLSVTLDPLYTLVSSSTPPVAISGTTYSFLVGALAPGDFQTVEVTVNLPASVPLGTLLSSTVSVDLPDSDPGNSTHDINETVVASFDPNMKEVFTQAGINADGNIYPGDSVLFYTVHFQNLGTADATFVIIRDTLDPNLDPASLVVHGASHAMSTTFTTSGSLEFRFMGIGLPPASVDEPGSHGYVKYSIKPKAGLAIGTAIDNTAHIYFDFNPAVVTNTVSSLLSLVGVMDGTGPLGLTAYPVPATSMVQLEGRLADHTCRIRLTDLSGKMAREWSLDQGSDRFSAALDLTGISPGAYLLVVESGSQRDCIRLIKQ